MNQQINIIDVELLIIYIYIGEDLVHIDLFDSTGVKTEKITNQLHIDSN